MKASVILSLVVLAAQPAHAADVPACTKQQVLGLTAKRDEAKTHLQFALPFISYPFGTKIQEWGINLLVRIDESGRVVCASINNTFSDEPLPLNKERRAFVKTLKDWRYTPFTHDGKPVVAVLTEQINEREIPEQHLTFPSVPQDKVHISLARSGCYGTCPIYKVVIDGDGRVTFNGHKYLDVLRVHHYRVPRADVIKLLDTLRATDIWSLRKQYRASITDNPTHVLNIYMDRQTHRLEDYVGESAGDAVLRFRA